MGVKLSKNTLNDYFKPFQKSIASVRMHFLK
jgi:hypothetical protein